MEGDASSVVRHDPRCSGPPCSIAACWAWPWFPTWRGRGLGERLIRQTLDAARAFGFSRVELTVRDDNARAQALYRNVGFETEGRKRRAVLVDGVFYDLIVMAFLSDAVRPSGSDTMASG